MSIILLVEGETERALTGKIKEFIDDRSRAHSQPRISLQARKIKSLNPQTLGRQIKLYLSAPDVAAVVGFIDVFPHFDNATTCKNFLINAAKIAGVTHGFFAHAAQYDVEAWLLPYWDDICRRINVRQGAPGHDPEQVDNTRPPSYRLRELYQRTQPRRSYAKTLEMPAILKGKDLTIAANACPELKSLLNTLLALSHLTTLP